MRGNNFRRKKKCKNVKIGWMMINYNIFVDLLENCKRKKGGKAIGGEGCPSGHNSGIIGINAIQAGGWMGNE
jgi:hypothetical protein